MSDEEKRQCRCCGLAIPVGMLACRKHWYDLPRQLREAIVTTYRGGDRRAYVANVKQADKVWQDLDLPSRQSR